MNLSKESLAMMEISITAMDAHPHARLNRDGVAI